MSDEPPRILPYGQYQPETGFRLYEPSTSNLERRFDLSGIHLRISTIPYEPYTFLGDEKQNINNNTRTYRGLMMDAVKYIQTKTNFTYSILDENDGLWGTRDENGSWNGLIREIMENGADVRLVGCFVVSAFIGPPSSHIRS